MKEDRIQGAPLLGSRLGRGEPDGSASLSPGSILANTTSHSTTGSVCLSWARTYQLGSQAASVLPLIA